MFLNSNLNDDLVYCFLKDSEKRLSRTLKDSEVWFFLHTREEHVCAGRTKLHI